MSFSPPGTTRLIKTREGKMSIPTWMLGSTAIVKAFKPQIKD